MAIVMTDGRTYENSLDMLFAKDMPSREETDKQQRDKRMKEIDETMPPDMRGPPPVLYTPNEQDYYQHQEQFPKDQNDPSAWGMDEAIGRKGPAMVPLRDPAFHEVMNHMDYLIDPEKIQATPEGKSTYQDLKGFYEGAPPDLVHPKAYENLQQVDEARRKSLLWDTPVMSSKNPAMHEGDSESRFNHIDESLRTTQDELDKSYTDFKKNIEDAKKQGHSVGFIDTGPDQAGRVRMRFTPAARDYLENLPDDVDAIDMKDGTIVFQLKKAMTSENDTLPSNARPTSEETPPKSAYQNFTDKLEELSKSLNPSFIPTAEQFRDAPWKEKLGFIIASSFMFAGPGKGPKGMPGKSDPLSSWKEGLAEFDKTEHPVINTLRQAEKEGSQTAANLLGEYRKIDDPVVRAEFSKIVKDKIASASEGGENAPSDITNPTIRGMKEGSDWSEVITRPDGTKETVYDTAKIERLRNLRDNGLTFTEIGEKMGVSRNSVNSMLRRLKKMDAEESSLPESKAGIPWTPAQDKILTTWYNDPNSDLVNPPALLKHRSEGAIDARIKHLGLEKAAEEEAAKSFVPKGAVSAPEKGSGSGGYEGPVNTELEGKSGISTPNTTPKNANVNVDPKTLDLTTPEMEAAMEKTWKNFGAAQEKDIPMLSPLTMEKLKAINPTAAKKLQQFELEMDYKHKSSDRAWLSDLEPKDIKRYQDLYAQAQKEPPRDVNDIKYRIRQMLTSPEAQKILKEEAASKRPKNSFQKFLDALKDEEP